MANGDLYLNLDWPYDDALAWMEAARERVLEGGPMMLAVGSHREEVITLGRHAPGSQLLFPGALEARGALVRRIERGGGATAHGPGQLVCYPIVHLEALGLSVPGLTGALERAVIRLLEEHGISGKTDPNAPGVYVDGAKIASIGFRVRRGVVTHGLAVNVENDLGLFALIAACGRERQPMARLCDLISEAPDLDRLARRLAFLVAEECMIQLRL